MPKSELKPCPFCGGKLTHLSTYPGMVAFYICEDCQMRFEVPFHDDQEFDETLNNRKDGEKKIEFSWIEQFIKQNDFDHDSLRCLWTTYCLHHNLDVDTAEYDVGIANMWFVMNKSERDTVDWYDLNSFDNFMGMWLT